MDALVGVHAKLDRADAHYDQLDRAISVFLADSNYHFGIEIDRNRPYPESLPDHEEMAQRGYDRFPVRIVYLEIDDYPPDELWGPVIGDVIHNLRSALDHLAWEIAVPSVRTRMPRGVAFPIFFEETKAFKDVLKRLRSEFHALIESAQPFQSGDLHHPLWLLDKLWNTDKHRSLHTADFMFSQGPDDPTNPFGYASWSRYPMDRTRLRTEISQEFGTWMNMGDEERLVPIVAQTRDVALARPDDPASEGPWPPDSPYAGLPLRPMLRRIRQFIQTEVVAPVERVLEAVDTTPS
jgi:hypothetical protein